MSIVLFSPKYGMPQVYFVALMLGKALPSYPQVLERVLFNCEVCDFQELLKGRLQTSNKIT